MSHVHFGWSIEDDEPVLRAHILRDHAADVTLENHRARHEEEDPRKQSDPPHQRPFNPSETTQEPL